MDEQTELEQLRARVKAEDESTLYGELLERYDTLAQDAERLAAALQDLHQESVKYETQPRFPEDRKRLHLAHQHARAALADYHAHQGKEERG